MEKGDRNQTLVVVGAGQGGGDLQETLRAHQIGLEMRTERIAAPGHAGGAPSGAAQEGVIHHRTERGLGRELGSDRATNGGEDLGKRQTVFGEELFLLTRLGPLAIISFGPP